MFACTLQAALLSSGGVLNLDAPLLPHVQEPARAVCTITAAAHAVPGGQLSLQPAYSGNDRISVVPLERWDVQLPAADNPSGAAAGRARAAGAPWLS